MEKSDIEHLTTSRLTSLREKWSKPDSRSGHTWDFDGVYHGIEYWKSYDHEMRGGLKVFGCKSFDDLVIVLGNKLDRKPNVIDLMGGAYFLKNPENTNSFTGIRVHDKDSDFFSFNEEIDDELSVLTKKIISAPNRRIIEADILTVKGWNDIEKAEIPKADLLVCRPVGPFDVRHAMTDGFDKSGGYVGLYLALFKRMLKLVNKEGGVIFTEIPDVYNTKEINKFLKDLDEKENSRSRLFTVPDKDYHWGRVKRKYVVTQF
jgi:hypothetical protein